MGEQALKEAYACEERREYEEMLEWFEVAGRKGEAQGYHQIARYHQMNNPAELERIISYSLKANRPKSYENLMMYLESMHEPELFDQLPLTGKPYYLQLGLQCQRQGQIPEMYHYLELAEEYGCYFLFMYADQHGKTEEAKKYRTQYIQNLQFGPTGSQTQGYFGVAFYYQHKMPPNEKKMLKYYQLAIENPEENERNQKQSYINLAVFYQMGGSDAMFKYCALAGGCPNIIGNYHQRRNDLEKANTYYLQGHKEGDVHATHNLSISYISSNPEKRRELLQIAAQRNHIPSLWKLAELNPEDSSYHQQLVRMRIKKAYLPLIRAYLKEKDLEMAEALFAEAQRFQVPEIISGYIYLLRQIDRLCPRAYSLALENQLYLITDHYHLEVNLENLRYIRQYARFDLLKPIVEHQSLTPDLLHWLIQFPRPQISARYHYVMDQYLESLRRESFSRFSRLPRDIWGLIVPLLESPPPL